jgi:hypothetical protein
MKLGIKELRAYFSWLGSRVWGGVLEGVGLGVLLGLIVHDYVAGMSTEVVVCVCLVISFLGQVVVGRPATAPDGDSQ